MDKSGFLNDPLCPSQRDRVSLPVKKEKSDTIYNLCNTIYISACRAYVSMDTVADPGIREGGVGSGSMKRQVGP